MHGREGKMRVLRLGVCIGICLAGFILGGSATLAQLPTGTILGVAKDSSGAVAPGAKVTARETQTNQTRTGQTGTDGAYRFDSLPVGNYTITAEAAGFQTVVQSGLTLTVGQEAVVNFTLQVGTVSQTVSVSAVAGNLVDTTTSSLGSLVNEDQIEDLPLNGRNYNDLTLLQAGVAKSIGASNSSAQIGYSGTAYSSNGAPIRSNMYLLDGAIQQSVSGINGSSALGTTLGVDGILEYKVITSSYDAEYGQTMGSQMTIVSKGGSNTFHGNAFDFLRNSALDARNHFDLPPSRLLGPDGDEHRNPEFHRNQFGGSLGGPIQKDKTFFFVTYEGLRAFLGVTKTATTLGTEANPNGCHGAAGATITLAQCPQLGAPSATITSQMAPFLGLYPAPDLPGTANNYGFVFDQITPEDYGQVRIDHTISAKDSLFGRYTIDQSSLPIAGNFNSNYALEHSRNQFLTLAEEHIFSSDVVNSARFSFTREPLQLSAVTTDPRLLEPDFEFVASPLGMGNISATGVGAIGDSFFDPRVETENIFSGSDDVNYNHGKHSFKFGALFNHYQYLLVQHGYDRGTLSFATLAALMQGGPISSFSVVLPTANNVTRYEHFDTMGFYAQDSWKVFRRLTLNYGMRYEPTTTVNEIHGNAGTLRDFPASADFTVGSRVFLNPSLRNWSPRLGFAYDVFGNGKTAIRGGFDVLYDVAAFGPALGNAAGYDPPLAENISLTNYTQTFGTIQIPMLLPTGQFQQSFRGLIYRPSQPHLLSYNFSVQQQLPDQMALTVAYVGSHGINLLTNPYGNLVLPSGVPGVDGFGNQICNEVPASTSLNNANQFDGPGATSCYAVSTTTNPQCWPAGGITQPGTNCFSRQNSNLLGLFPNTTDSESFYNALNVTLNKRVTHGLQFQAAYSFSKSNDDRQGVQAVEAADIYVDPLHPHSAYGPSSFDIRDNFHFDALYRFPNFASSKGFLGKLADGWGINGILTLQTGYPFSVSMSGNRANAETSDPDLIPGRNNGNTTHGTSSGCNGVAAGTPLRTTHLWYDPCAFSVPAAGFIGTEPRNVLVGPGMANVDFSIVKDTPIRRLGEGGKIEFRAEVFDLFNHALLSLPNGTASAGSCAGTPDPLAGCAITVANGAGSISSTILGTGGLPGGQRQIQFGLKLMF
jgi:hypothetical protein